MWHSEYRDTRLVEVYDAVDGVGSPRTCRDDGELIVIAIAEPRMLL